MMLDLSVNWDLPIKLTGYQIYIVIIISDKMECNFFWVVLKSPALFQLIFNISWICLSLEVCKILEPNEVFVEITALIKLQILMSDFSVGGRRVK